MTGIIREDTSFCIFLFSAKKTADDFKIDYVYPQVKYVLDSHLGFG